MTKMNTRLNSYKIPDDFFKIKDLVYNTCGFECSHPEPEAESEEYGACTFNINGKTVKFRVAKTTPTKTGQFVTLWKRSGDGPIEPFHITDDIDLFVISTRGNTGFGQFIFTKTILHQKGVLSDTNKEGKRAIRVYPPWDNVTSKQAQKTQEWQSAFFLEITQNQQLDIIRAKKLY